jgi:hypothetical protein
MQQIQRRFVRQLRRRAKQIALAKKSYEGLCQCHLDGPGCLRSSKLATYFAPHIPVTAFRPRSKKASVTSDFGYCQMLCPHVQINSF